MAKRTKKRRGAAGRVSRWAAKVKSGKVTRDSRGRITGFK